MPTFVRNSPKPLVAFLALVGLLMAGLVASCGSSDDSAVAIRAIDEILDGPIEITALTSQSATVRVSTSIDVVCSVVYGTDETYGKLSTDLDMAGTGHSSHSAPLRGLAPDTTYFYRLQGTGPDGTLYVSDSLTFRTLAEQTSGNGRTNAASLSAGATIAEVSSVFNQMSTWRAQNAIDGDPSTEWSSAGDGNNAFITVELAGKSHLTAVGLWTRTMGSSAEITQFRVITEDGTILGPFRLEGTPRIQEFAVEVTAQRLRFEVVASSGGNTGIVELVAYRDD